MIRVCSWCGCRLGEVTAVSDTEPTHGICSRCLVSLLEELEALATRQSRLMPVAPWLIVVASDDVTLFLELQQRFSQSSLVDVIRDRRTSASSGAGYTAEGDRRFRGRSEEHDRLSFGFFVVHRPGSAWPPSGTGT
jgi:hypothetical protein